MKKFTTAEDLEMGDILFNSRNCLAQLESALAYAEELLKIQEKLEQREGRE